MANSVVDSYRFLEASSASSHHEPLIRVSLFELLLVVTPLLGIAGLSWRMGLQLESPICIGIVRTFVQLSILGLILQPIFTYGLTRWWLVVLYSIFMVCLASYESFARASYSFSGMFALVFGILLLNLSCMAMFAFGVVLQPSPVWDPQYVIPMCGMLLGNSINGVSVALSTILNHLVQDQAEIHLWLSVGATPREATRRMVRQTVRTAALPQINGMAIIGLISIPGMMTGQILGGTAVPQAARYQMLITYMIAVCVFLSILSLVYGVLGGIAFETSTGRLRTDRMIKREGKPSILQAIQSVWQEGRNKPRPLSLENEATELLGPKFQEEDTEEEGLPSFQGKFDLQIVSSFDEATQDPVRLLQAWDVSKEFDRSGGMDTRHAVWKHLTFVLHAGQVCFVTGPSGSGKTTLLRVLSGLVASTSGALSLQGRQAFASDHNSMSPTEWRHQVRYVTQSKVDLVGTPRDFIHRLAELQVHKKSPHHQNVVVQEWISRTSACLQDWGFPQQQHVPSLLDAEWKTLSGGESQRVLLALTLATEPSVVLLDEPTAALDASSKARVEASLVDYVQQKGQHRALMWITHDVDQIERVRGQMLSK